MQAEPKEYNDLGCAITLFGAVGGYVAGVVVVYVGLAKRGYDHSDLMLLSFGVGVAYSVIGGGAAWRFRRAIERNRTGR